MAYKGEDITDKIYLLSAKYCDKNTMPGGHNIPQIYDMMGRFFLSCGPGNVFSGNTDYQGVFTIVDCTNGKWTPQEVPSCVGKLGNVSLLSMINFNSLQLLGHITLF